MPKRARPHARNQREWCGAPSGAPSRGPCDRPLRRRPARHPARVLGRRGLRALQGFWRARRRQHRGGARGFPGFNPASDLPGLLAGVLAPDPVPISVPDLSGLLAAVLANLLESGPLVTGPQPLPAAAAPELGTGAVGAAIPGAASAPTTSRAHPSAAPAQAPDTGADGVPASSAPPADAFPSAAPAPPLDTGAGGVPASSAPSADTTSSTAPGPPSPQEGPPDPPAPSSRDRRNAARARARAAARAAKEAAQVAADADAERSRLARAAKSWPKWLKATSGASGCVGTSARACPCPPAALLRASLAFPGRRTSQSVTPIAVLHSSLHSIIIVIIHHAASAASREREEFRWVFWAMTVTKA